MTTSLNNQAIIGMHIEAEEFVLDFNDGRSLSIPLWWYPRLYKAKPEERQQWEFCAGGRGIHWPMIDEDISLEALLEGRKAPNAKRPDL
jgi:hypothetical protein